MINFNNIKLFIATPCYGGMCTEGYLQSILQLVRQLSDKGVTIALQTIGNESLISRARNSLATKFLYSEFTHLLFIDSDIEFTPIQVLRLLVYDKAISCGAYPLKSSTKLSYATHISNPKIEKGWFKTDYAATGFLLVKKFVLEKIMKKYPEKQYINQVAGYNFTHAFEFFPVGIDPNTKQYLSEDYYFSKLAKSCGFTIWCDAKSKLTHIGTHKFKGDLQLYLDS